MENVLQATIELAVAKHGKQTRKNGIIPYISHPFDVLKKIHTWGIVDIDMLKAALTHDLLEDTDVTPDELKAVIGETAYGYVQELTFVLDIDSEYSKKEQKQAYLSCFDKKTIQALILKIADRIVNIYDFRNDNDAYAYIYTDQANCLFEAFSSKTKQIEEKFGPRVVYSIENEINNVTYAAFCNNVLNKNRQLELFKDCVNQEVVNKYKE